MKRSLKKYRLPISGLFVGSMILFGAYRLHSPIVLHDHKTTVEIGESFDAKKNLKYVFLGDVNRVKIKGTVNTKKLGEYTITYTYKKKQTEARIQVVDTKAPELKLKKVTTDTVGDVKDKDFIQSCKDGSKVKTELRIRKESKDAGEYKVTVTATDAVGNTTSETTTLVRKEDHTKPKIGKLKKISIVAGDEFALDDVSVSDDLDPKPSIKIDDSKVDYTTTGSYTITYTAKDRSGNTAKKKRTIDIIQRDVDKYDKIVYLTFDDGPSKNTKEVLKVLDQYDVKATFFVTGNHAEEDYKYMMEAYKAGHTIGLHSDTHDYSIYTSEETYFKDLHDIDKKVKNYTGEHSRVIRFPGGSSNTVSENYSYGLMDDLCDEVHKEGYEYFDWNVDSRDASGTDVPVNVLIKNSTGSDLPYINILFHDSDTKSTTAKALPKIIKHYKKKGYVFLPLTPGSYPVHHIEKEPTK